MAYSFISMLALWREDNTVFDLFELPDKMTDWRDNIINSLMLDTAELEVIYPSTTFMKQALGLWSRRNAYNWSKLYDTLFFDYNPIWNKDGTVTITTEGNTGNTRKYNRNGTDTRNIDYTHSGNNTNNSSDTVSETSSGTSNETINGSSSENVNGTTAENDTLVKSYNETVGNYVFGYNSESAAKSSEQTTGSEEKDTDTKSGSSTTNSSGTNSSTTSGKTGSVKSTSGTGTENKKETAEDKTVDKNVSTITDSTEDSGNSTGKENRIEQGNIGVTTTQSMIAEEREIVQFNLIDYIVRDFKNHFCILIY